jgi:putative addiction module component (TIGR02574 family)
MSNFEALLADASHLPVAERLQLIDAIWETLPADSLPPLSVEWTGEIQRRSAEYDAGSTETIAWEKVKTEALRRIDVTVPDGAR